MLETNDNVFISKPVDIFKKIKKDDFRQLLKIANRINPLPVDYLYQQYISGNEELTVLYKVWEKSVIDGKPDYSVYNNDVYINESFVCWKGYSRRYLLLLKKYLLKQDCEINKDDINSILDLGCGCGFSTIGLKALFPDVIVSATNLKGTIQYEIDISITKDIDGINIYDENEVFDLANVDMIFASEFFEHLVNPIEYLIKLIKTYRPKYFIFANTFNKMAIGHFYSYFYNDCKYDGKQISRKFNNTLRENGYTKVETNFFNHRPSIYKLVD